MELGTIFYEKDYSNACNYSAQNGYTIKEIEPDEQGRRFQIIEIPPLTDEQILEQLRYRREEECFPYINRGVLWYNTLTTEQQQQELNTWYQAWLNVPQAYLEIKPTDIETIIPAKPNWLK